MWPRITFVSHGMLLLGQRTQSDACAQYGSKRTLPDEARLRSFILQLSTWTLDKVSLSVRNFGDLQVKPSA